MGLGVLVTEGVVKAPAIVVGQPRYGCASPAYAPVTTTVSGSVRASLSGL